MSEDGRVIIRHLDHIKLRLFAAPPDHRIQRVEAPGTHGTRDQQQVDVEDNLPEIEEKFTPGPQLGSQQTS